MVSPTKKPKKPVFTGAYKAFRQALEEGAIQPWQRDPWPATSCPKTPYTPAIVEYVEFTQMCFHCRKETWNPWGG